jgi:hypothetical protein
MSDRTNRSTSCGRSAPPSADRASTASRRQKLRAIEDRIFTGRRLRLYASGMAVAWAFWVAWLLFYYPNIIGPGSEHACNDFSWMWVSGTFAGSRDAARVYDDAAFSAARMLLTGTPCAFTQNHFIYPPVYLFFTFFLGLMPYPTAWFVWVFATLLLYLAAVYAIIPRPLSVVAALTPYPVVFNFLSAHNGFLTAGLIGLSLAFMERKPSLSGLFVGFMTCKPQLGVLFPFALLSARKWRVLLSATAISLTLGLVAAMVFDHQGWESFFHKLIDRAPNLRTDLQQPVWLVSLFGFLQSAGVSTRVAWAAHLVVAVAIAVAVSALWAKPMPHSLKAAALSIGTVTVTPFVHSIDLCILPIAAAFLIEDGLLRGFLAGERTAMLICWLGFVLIGSPVQTVASLALCLVFLALVGRRILSYRSEISNSVLPADRNWAPGPRRQERRRMLHPRESSEHE